MADMKANQAGSSADVRFRPKADVRSDEGAPLNVRPTTAAELRGILKELAQRPLTAGGDYVHVQRACLLLSMYLKDPAPASVGKLMPEIVWHYLFDVDIRHKDHAYAVAQTDALLSALVAWQAEELG